MQRSKFHDPQIEQIKACPSVRFVVFFDDKIWVGLFSKETIERINELESKPSSTKSKKIRLGVSVGKI